MVKGLEQWRIQLARLFASVRVQSVGPRARTDRSPQPPMFIPLSPNVKEVLCFAGSVREIVGSNCSAPKPGNSNTARLLR